MIPIEGVLDKYGVEYNPDKDRNQQVRCVFHDDRHASASVNLGQGVFNCFTCDVRGDAVELLIVNEGLSFVAAKQLAEELAGGVDRPLSRGSDGRRSGIPRKSGHRQGRRNWTPPWSRGRSGPGA